MTGWSPRSAAPRLGGPPVPRLEATAPAPGAAAELLAWAAILGLALVVAVCLVTRRGGLLEALYPALGLGVGALLLAVRPYLFFGFVLWLWFLSPFLRRVAGAEGAGAEGTASAADA